MVDFSQIPRYYHQCPDLNDGEDLPRMTIGDSYPQDRDGNLSTQWICPRCNGKIYKVVKSKE